MTVTSFESAETHIYYWPRSFVMRTSRFQQEFREKPYQRLSATIVANPRATFTLQAGESDPITTQLALLSPGSRRRQLNFDGGDGFLFDIDITSSAYQHIKPLLPLEDARAIEGELAEPVLSHLAGHADQALQPPEALTLFDEVVALLAPDDVRIRGFDSRIREILDIIDANARDEITVAGLAKRVGLSESRLRSLVQSQLGCNLARYLRWAAAWKTAELWKPGITYTEVAHAAGFHDLSHANRTFVELFGMPPSKVLRSEHILLYRCER